METKSTSKRNDTTKLNLQLSHNDKTFETKYDPLRKQRKVFVLSKLDSLNKDVINYPIFKNFEH
jgi:hypothetical protein